MKAVDREEYVALVRARWSDWCLTDAKRNFVGFAELHDKLVDYLASFHRDPQQKDLNDRSMNPDGTLTAFLFRLQTAIEPNNSCLAPLLDFNDRSQTIFLRRGLIAYCQLVLRELETVEVADDGKMLPL